MPELPDLTNLQRDEMIEQYVEIVVGQMSHGQLIDYAKEEMANYHDSLSDQELIEHIDCYDPDLCDELIDNVTNDTVLDPKEYSWGKETS